ncbi:hypothetical protein Bpfe_013811 [Biomphalaria pfeifferi]|uniref:Uncharacterized protein n=1 Tax=Biomphalaria pfeifferi TaxID=112525 RepID=A0AAD8BMN9_BIOPF|nr:hypothetical protein Bpfe_013811 [Biomphalaria pfeifferi]
MSQSPSPNHNEPSADEDEGSAVDDQKFNVQQAAKHDTDEDEKSSLTDSKAHRPSIPQEEHSEGAENSKGSGTATSQGSFDSVDSLNVEGISLVRQSTDEMLDEADPNQVKVISPDLLEARPNMIPAATPPLSTNMPSRRATPDPKVTPVSGDDESAPKENVGSESDVPGSRDETDSIVQLPDLSVSVKDNLLQEAPQSETQDSKELEMGSSRSLSVTSPAKSLQGEHEENNLNIEKQNVDKEDQSLILDDQILNQNQQSFHQEDPSLYQEAQISEDLNEESCHVGKGPEITQEIFAYDTVDVSEKHVYDDTPNVFLNKGVSDHHKDDDSFYASAEENVDEKVTDKNSMIRLQLADADMEEQTVEIVDDVYSETYAPRDTCLEENELYGSVRVYKTDENNVDDDDDDDEHISSVSEHGDNGHPTFVKASNQDRHLFTYSANAPYTLGDSFSQYEKLTKRSLGDTDELMSGYQDNSSVVSDVFSPRLESHRHSSLSRLKSKMPKFSTVAYSFKRQKPQAPPSTPPPSPWTVYGDFGGYFLNGQNSLSSRDNKEFN